MIFWGASLRHEIQVNKEAESETPITVSKGRVGLQWEL